MYPVYARFVISFSLAVLAEQASASSIAADDDNVEKVLELAFASESVESVAADVVEVQKVLAERDWSVSEILREVSEITTKLSASVQNVFTVKHLSTMLEDNEKVKKSMEEAISFGGDALRKAKSAITMYAKRAAENKKLVKAGKTAKLWAISKSKNVAKRELQDALDELQSQKELMTDQWKSQSKMAGLFAVAQVAESSVRCYSAVTAYLEHKQQLGEWKVKVERWLNDLKENRHLMQGLVKNFLKTQEWDLSRLQFINWRASVVFIAVKQFNTELAAAKKNAESNRIAGLSGFVFDVVNMMVSIRNILTAPIAGLSGYSLSAGIHGVSTVANLATTVFAHLDLQQLGNVLSYGEALLRESSHQVEVLKKAGELVMQRELSKYDAEQQDDMDTSRTEL